MRRQFPRLTEPIQIKSLRLKNRMISAPMSCMLAGPDGYVTERIREFYRTLAYGQFGLIIVEASAILKDAGIGGLQLCIADGTYLPGLADLADIIHGAGTRACLQIVHGGGTASSEWIQGKRPASPSGLTFRTLHPGELPPRELTADEIEEILDAYGKAAARVQAARFDAVEIHMAHGTLPHGFMTPRLNLRKDRWGAPAAFAVEALRRVRRAVGPDFPVFVRISADDFVAGGAGQEQQMEIARLLEEAGADVLDVSAGRGDNRYDGWALLPVYRARASIVYLAEAVKKIVKVPVIAVGRLNDPDLCEQIIAKGRADMVAMGRVAWADPEFPRKVIEGKPDDIRRCAACDLCYRASIYALSARCSINYELGKMPWEAEIKPAERPKKVVIIGGGVAGMETARVASLRKHHVTLYEKDGTLGGAMLNVASAVPRLNTRDLRNGVRWLKHEIAKLEIKVELNKEATLELVAREKPDVLVVASGSQPLIPDIPGINRKNVITVDDYLKGRRDVGEAVVILGGGYGAEVALSLNRDGRQVTLVEEGRRIGDTPFLYPRVRVLKQFLDESTVKVFMETRVKEISDAGVIVIDKQGAEHLVKADTVVLAMGRVRDDRLAQQLRATFPEVYEVGDCDEPANMMEAVHAGARLARRI